MSATRARAVLARTPAADAAALGERLASAGGDPERVLADRTARAAHRPPAADIDADLAWLESSGARILLCTDPEYPPLLRQAPSPPAALYLLGSVAALAAPQLAIVGSRNPTPAGRATAHAFAAWFARAGLGVTSGLAAGIDAAAHEGALAGGGTTVAVCGSGLDAIYPGENTALAARIRERGALVSEFPPRTPPRRGNFPQRNRIIAGLSHGTLVVEAASRSGSLITARLAAEAGREVFAIPGSIHSPLSRGCHQLIKSGAKLVEEAADVLAELNISVPEERLSAAPRAGASAGVLDKEYEMLLDALGFEPATIDVLVARTHLAPQSVASMLLILELEGRVAAVPGGRYAKAPQI